MTSLQAVRARDMWSEGATTKAIAARLGLAESALSGYISRHRDEFHRRHHMITETERRFIFEQHEAGVTMADIARAVGCSPSGVKKVLTSRKEG